MKVLVTGAAGLIGSAVVAELSKAGHAVRAFDRRMPPDGPRHSDAADWQTGDLAEADTARRAVDGVNAVAHLAAIPSPWKVPDDVVYLNNTGATFQILTEAGSAGISRVVLASSISILGLAWAPSEVMPPHIPITEESSLQVADPYALSKQADEAAGAMAYRRWGTTVLAYRFPDVGSSLRLRDRGRHVQHDPGVARRELWAYLHVADAALAVRLGIETPVTGFRVINIVADDSLGGVDVTALVRRFYPGTPILSDITPGSTAYKTDRAKDILGFRAQRHWSGT